MDCNKGGFGHARHDNLRNLEAAFGKHLEVCNYVAVQLHLQPITAIGEEFDLWLANRDDEARLDVKVRGFYRQGQSALFDIRVAHLNK